MKWIKNIWVEFCVCWAIVCPFGIMFTAQLFASHAAGHGVLPFWVPHVPTAIIYFLLAIGILSKLDRESQP